MKKEIIEELTVLAASTHGLDADALFRRGETGKLRMTPSFIRARRCAYRMAQSRFRWSMSETAEAFGVDYSTVSHALSHGTEAAE